MTLCRYNLAIASDSHYESAAIELFESAALSRDLSTYLIKPYNLEQTYERVLCREIEFDSHWRRPFTENLFSHKVVTEAINLFTE